MKEKTWIEQMNEVENIRLFSRLFARSAKKGQLSSAQEVDALFRSALQSDGITPLELSSQMGCSKTIVSRIADRLTQKEYVKKVKHKTDGRSYRIQITDSGRQALDSVYRYYAEPVMRLEQRLGETDFERLMYLLQKANAAAREKEETI